MGDNLHVFDREQERPLAKVQLSRTFQELTGRWIGRPCVLQRFDEKNPNVGVVEIPGEKRPVRVHRMDFFIDD